MVYSHITLFILWAGWCFLHSFLANERIKMFIYKRISISRKAYRGLYNIFSTATLAGVMCFQVQVHPVIIFNTSALIDIMALIFIMTGLSIMTVCISRYFGQMSGIRKVTPFLITTGLHRFVRHPLYSGTFIFLAGIILLFPLAANLIACTIIIGYTLWRIKAEEKKLVNIFGLQYIQYQKKVPMLIPFL